MTVLTAQSTANLDWPTLIQQAAPYTDTVSTTDPVSKLTDLTYYGLQTTLSAVLKSVPASKLHSVSIFADTLILDVATIPTSGLLLAVRNLDVSSLNGQSLEITPGSDGSAVAEILIGACIGGNFTLGITGQGSPVTPATGTGPLTISSYVASKGTGFSILPPGAAGNDNSLLGSAWMINALYASFAAASWLMEDQTSTSSAAAQSMFAWVVTCTAGLVANNNLPSDYSQLYNQAAALLVTLNVAPGATFVPVLSGTYYSQHLTDIITVIRDYEANMNTLDTATNIDQAIASVSSTLQSVASDEVTPLQVQLTGISNQVKSLYSDISSLRAQFQLQSQAAHAAFVVMSTRIVIGEIYATLQAAMDMTLSGISTSLDAVKMINGDGMAVKDLIGDAVGTIKGLVNTIQSAQGGSPAVDISEQATTLLNTQMAIMEVILNASLLYQQAIDNQSGGVLPASLSSITIDPVTDWDNYLASAEAEITSLQRGISTDAQDAADNYLASIKILAAYGKAIGGKFVAFVSQLVQATVVMAQITAANNVEQRWAAAQQNATSDMEKLAALKALILGRMQAIKRSLYIAWTYYAASYFYLNFTSPPQVLHMEMDAAELEDALVGVADWVAQALSSTPDGQHVQLPSDNAQIPLAFEILQPGGTVPVGATDVALLSKLDDGTWSLVFTVPMGTDQLEGVLPHDGNVAIWISEASFFFDGITPNSKGNVITNVSTSGTYQNGYGGSETYTFVTSGLSGAYAYSAANQSVYSAWAINTAVYMTPTPYTQWNITLSGDSGDPSTATRLRMQLKIAFRTS